MAANKESRIKRAVRNLETSLERYKIRKKDDDLPFLTAAKALEVLIEYCWKEMKKRVEEDGLLAPTPKEAIRQAAVAGYIERPEEWLNVLTARNDSVHDYFSLSERDYIRLAGLLVQLVKESKLIK